MAPDNYSVEACIIDGGKTVRGILTLFADEYSFGGKRKTVRWEDVICKKGTATVRGFLRSTEKPYITFKANDSISPQFIMEQAQLDIVLNAIASFIETQKRNPDEKKVMEKAEARSIQTQITSENNVSDETAQNASNEHKRKSNAEQLNKAEEERKAQSFECKKAEKQAHIQKTIEIVKNQLVQNENIVLCSLAKKAGSCFLDNPYRILGVSCLATNKEANMALDKLKKLARLKALESYQSPFDLIGIEKPTRDLSVAQNAISRLKDKSSKWFWFAESDPCIAWQSGKYRIELVRDGQELGTYDLFLANYLYAVLCDPDFKTPETWKRVLAFYCYICKQDNCELLRSRYTDNELQSINNTDLLNSFQSSIFKPLLLLCDRDDLDAVLRLYKCIKDCNDQLLDVLSRNVLSRLVSWFTDKEALIIRYLNEVASEEYISESKAAEIRKHGDIYCKKVEPVLEMVLHDFRGDAVRCNMIKESYRIATYQLMYVLNKCENKSDAIYFANKCYSYCKADDKKRILNTFGKVNIKTIDWNVPHTKWDAKGDEFYYGRGCAVDYIQALYWYHKAADAGNMYSQNSIGICYQKGQGVPQNDEQAFYWFEKAYESGNPEGAYNLAECCFSGTGTEKNIDQALEYWAQAARLGHPSAKQRRDEVFSEIKSQRRIHRAHNHVCHDIGFQMTTGPALVVEVTLNHAAYVYLVNYQGYQNYLNGDVFSHYGGYAANSPFRIRIPSSNHWYVVIDNGDEPVAEIISSAKVKRADL